MIDFNRPGVFSIHIYSKAFVHLSHQTMKRTLKQMMKGQQRTLRLKKRKVHLRSVRVKGRLKKREKPQRQRMMRRTVGQSPCWNTSFSHCIRGT